VGIIGSEANPANLLFMAVPLVAIIGAALARLRPAGMAWAMVATALSQIAATVFAAGEQVQAYGFAAIFVVGWLAAAACFRRAV
jgi:hypothetical protein